MTAQASTGLIETWWVAKLGSDALTGMALVFRGFLMMQMISGGGRRGDADALVAHALLINTWGHAPTPPRGTSKTGSA
jgi:Na+-driven multidrug efflux pump